MAPAEPWARPHGGLSAGGALAPAEPRIARQPPPPPPSKKKVSTPISHALSPVRPSHPPNRNSIQSLRQPPNRDPSQMMQPPPQKK